MITSPSGQVSDDYEIMEGDSERFECNIDYEKELTTAYGWLKDDQKINSDDYLVIDGVRVEDDGVYACQTEDDFNLATSQFNLRVQFSPRTTFTTGGSNKGEAECNFIIGQTGNCQISFYSYPIAENIKLTKGDGSEVRLSIESLIENSNQIVTLKSDEVSEKDAGSYQLTVTSDLFPSSPLYYDVTITVGESTSGLSKENKIIISCCTVGGFLVLVVIFCCVRRNKKKNKKNDDDSSIGSVESGKNKEHSAYANAAF